MINLFPTLEPIALAYFAYGAAFLFLTVSIGGKNMKGSNLRIADGLWLLALFGLFQGLHEFIYAYPLLEGEHLTNRHILDLEMLAAALLAGSFLLLLQFGIVLSFPERQRRLRIAAAVYGALLAAVALLLWLEVFPSSLRAARLAQILSRNLLGLPAGLMTAWGMIRYSGSREIDGLSPVIARNLSSAGVVFCVYAFISTTFFSDLARSIDIPGEFFRAGTAVLVAYFIVKALNIFDVETRYRVEMQARELMQAERLVSLGKLAAGIAHEINNPLTNASLGIQLAKKKLRGAEQAVGDHLNAVERSIDRAAAIAQELLLFSRERETDFGPVGVSDAIRSSIAQLSHKLDRVQVKLDLQELPPIRGDRGKLEQVFINVLSNASEAMPHGGIITVSSALRGDNVEIAVTDTGAGIGQDILSKVFDPFFTTKDVGSGTGLGLYICYGIVRQHHGTIDIASVPGKGTTVSIRFPAVR